ncbi:hypothetical protein BDZ89DRAFT_1059187 [Hymenopellis radicata]|nr:hypothetical protein BDZ89DRAFT_1059187 [Hymenopellis radicata]
MPSGDARKEGTPDNPVFLTVPASDFSSLCYFLYNVEQYWTFTKTPGEYYLGLLRLASLYQFPEGIAFAKRRIDTDVHMEPYEKLALGIQHNERKWVETSLDYLFLSGANMRDPSPAEADALAKHLWTIANGRQLMATTTRELISTPPRMLVGSADASDWSHSRCDQHSVCIAGIASQWRQVASKLGASITDRSSFSIQLDLGPALRDFKFKRMDPRCRDALIKELTDRADVFHTRIIAAVADKLLLPVM